MKWKLVLAVIFLFGLSGVAFAPPPEGNIEPTMEKMEMTILAVSLTKDDDTSVEIFSGEYTFNPHDGEKGDIIGNIIENTSVPAGTYTGLTVTITRLSTIKMYVNHPTTGDRIMQTTSSGIQKAFQGTPLDPADYDDFRFLMPEDPSQNMDPSTFEAADPSLTPSTAGSFTKGPPSGTFTCTVEDGKTTTITMKMHGGEPDDGFESDGEGEFKNPAGNSQYETGEPT